VTPDARVGTRAAGTVRLIHPFPSLLDGLLTAGLARLAGAGLEQAFVLGLAMFCLQASIGALNDLADIEHDRGQKPGKPLPRGLVSPGAARLVVAAGLAAGLGLSLAGGLVTVGVAIAGLAIGYAYDLGLKASRWSWLPFALGLPLLPVYAWVGATGAVPGAFLVLVPMAVIGGAALALANELADAERDRAADVRTAVGSLGRERAWRVGLGLELIVALVAGGSLVLDGAPVVAIGAADGSIALLMIGLALSRSPLAGTRERGWEAQAVALGCLALAWLGGLASRSLL
jgi:geranylgeranylglycerol-phosphate geranylgeranyltransferase